MKSRRLSTIKTVKYIIGGIISLMLISMAVLGVTFWLLMYLDTKTPDNIEYDEIGN